MQREAVPLAVENNGSRTIGPAGVLGHKQFAAVRNDGRDGIIQPAIGVKIDHRSLVGRLLVSAAE